MRCTVSDRPPDCQTTPPQTPSIGGVGGLLRLRHTHLARRATRIARTGALPTELGPLVFARIEVVDDCCSPSATDGPSWSWRGGPLVARLGLFSSPGLAPHKTPHNPR